MTNAEKYRTAEERAKEFGKWCEKYKTFDSNGNIACAWRCVFCSFAWLDLEAEEEILPCPCCGGECVVVSHSEGHNVGCRSRYCYVGKTFESKDDAIANHNRIARAVIEEGKKEDVAE